jgi:predicted enzyme related to lactoylglutathione lyase
MPRVVHFEIQASRPEALIKFYSDLLGWSFTKWKGPAEYWLIETGPADKPGINGGLLPRQGDMPAAMQSVNCFVCTVEVSSLDDSLQRSSSLGGTVAVPRMAIQGIGWLAYVKDPDGNIFGLLQPDAKAA